MASHGETGKLRQRLETNPKAVELIALRQWVCFKLVERGGKLTKIPYTTTPDNVRQAKSNDPSTWGTLDEALAIMERGSMSGVGFMFSATDPYCGIDIDKCRDPNTGHLNRLARMFLDKLGEVAYSDVSPSGTGIHLIVRATLTKAAKVKLPNCAVEIYFSGRFFTMTGVHIS